MLLSQSKVGTRYRVVSLSMAEDSKRRFEILGLIPGSTVTVINYKRNGARIIRLRGTRYAIGPAFSRSVELEEM